MSPHLRFPCIADARPRALALTIGKSNTGIQKYAEQQRQLALAEILQITLPLRKRGQIGS
jgi:hypothetical protein